MFEKEAEEICSKYFEENCYKKNKWADTHDLVAMWQDGYNTANEWHFVKDGDLPKKTGEYLVYRISGYGCKSTELIQYNMSRHFWCVDCQNEVIAWKEIVLPKESEE